MRSRGRPCSGRAPSLLPLEKIRKQLRLLNHQVEIGDHQVEIGDWTESERVRLIRLRDVVWSRARRVLNRAKLTHAAAEREAAQAGSQQRPGKAAAKPRMPHEDPSALLMHRRSDINRARGRDGGISR